MIVPPPLTRETLAEVLVLCGQIRISTNRLGRAGQKHVQPTFSVNDLQPSGEPLFTRLKEQGRAPRESEECGIAQLCPERGSETP